MDWDEIVDSIQTSLTDLAEDFISFAPKLIAALLILIVGSIVATFIAKVVGKGLRFIETNKNVKGILKKANISNFSISGLISKLIRLVILFVFVKQAAATIELAAITDTINKLEDFIPKIIAAAIVAGLTVVAARILKDIIGSALSSAKVSHGDVIANGASIAIMIFGLTLAVSQLGLDTTLITTNLSIIVAGIVGAAALAFGLGGRKVAGSMLAGMYAKDVVKKGQKLVVDDVEGEVVSVSTFATTLKTSKGDVIVSNGRLMK